MGREPEFDKKMPRTVGRPVVRGLISPKQAYQFDGILVPWDALCYFLV